MKLNVKDAIGNGRCIVRDEGQKIYERIHPVLKGGEEVTLDFDGISQYASPFFNHAVGRLFKDIEPEVLEDKLHFENINETGSIIVRWLMPSWNRWTTTRIDDFLCLHTRHLRRCTRRSRLPWHHCLRSMD